MTGTVTWEVLLWVVGIVGGAGAAVAAFLFWLWGIVKALRDDFDKELEGRDLKIEAVHAKVSLQDAEFNEYKVHAAERFATKDGVTQAIDRMEAAVERLTTQVHDAVERLTSRLDRMLENRDAGRRD